MSYIFPVPSLDDLELSENLTKVLVRKAVDDARSSQSDVSVVFKRYHNSGRYPAWNSNALSLYKNTKRSFYFHKNIRSGIKSSKFAKYAYRNSKISQTALIFNTEYVAQSSLIRQWIDSLQSFQKDRLLTWSEMTPVERSEISTLFSRRIVSSIADFALQLRKESKCNVTLIDSGRFNPLAQVAICDRTMIVPDRSKEFLDVLADDLSQHLLAGGSISGDWGSLSIRIEKVVMSLNALEAIAPGDFQKAKRVE